MKIIKRLLFISVVVPALIIVYILFIALGLIGCVVIDPFIWLFIGQTPISKFYNEIFE